MGWTLLDSEAVLETAQFTWKVPFLKPTSGIAVCQSNVATWESEPRVHALAFTPTPPSPSGDERVVEIYVRGTDLIVVYGELPDRDVRPQAVWRDLSSDCGLPALELQVFVQTDWLWSRPEIHFWSRLRSPAEILQLGHANWNPIVGSRSKTGEHEQAVTVEPPGAFLFRGHDDSYRYVELVYPSDFHGGTLIRTKNGDAVLNYTLIQGPLEKGVVRVGRIWTAILPPSVDPRRAADLYGMLCQSPLPLTA